MRSRIRVTSKVNGVSHGQASESGFTIIEMMVGIVVFTIVMGSIYGLLMVARGGRINTNQRSEIMQNARMAINTMSRDAINAGVGYPNEGAYIPDNRLTTIMGGVNDADTNEDLLTPVNARNGSITINGVASDQVSFLFVDDTFNAGVSLPITAWRNNGANVQISAGWNNAPCAQNDIYLLTAQNGCAMGMMHDAGAEIAGVNTDKVTFATGDILGLNNPGGAASPIFNCAFPGTLQRVLWVSYFIVADVGSTQTGTLMRRVYGGATGWVDQPLAYGIESLQFQYVLENGSVVDLPALIEMKLVRQVRLSVAVRSPDIDPTTKLPYRTTLTSTFSTRNTAYEKL